MREFKFGNHILNQESSAFLIAEIGHNHQGSLEQCLEMIRAAAKAGCDAVKLQKRDNRALFTDEMYSEPYSSENSYGETYGEHREFLEFNKEQYLTCKKEAESLGLVFFATAFDIPSVDFLLDIGLPVIKIASGDLKSHYLLEYIAGLNVPMIISTGGANFADVVTTYRFLNKIEAHFAFLQCTAAYPAPPELLNLKVIERYLESFPSTIVGFSGHDNGIAMPLVSYALGARIIEKHFTLNRTLKGTDHAFSLEPEGMRKLARDLKRAHKALGSGEKIQLDEELKPLRKMSKMIVARKSLKKGHTLSLKDFDYKSPADGVTPDKVGQLLGKVLTRDVYDGKPILMEDVE